MATKKTTDESISVLEVQTGRIQFAIVGTTPLILNRMSEKVLHELLLPRGRKTAADKAAVLKHSPLDEYRASAYRSRDDTSPTRLQMLSTAFKSALRSVAVDMPGAAKAQIGRLTYIDGDYVPIYGVPQLHMSVTRSADMNKTPDVRTRAIVPKWASIVAITFVQPILRESEVARLLAAAGIMRGVGDWRPEKGSGSYGQFRITGMADPEFVALLKEGREAQDAALKSPECYDAETEELLSWYQAETNRRGFKAVA